AAVIAGLLACAPVQADDNNDKRSDVLLQADTVEYDSDRNVVTARGHVEVDRENRILMADQLSYDQNTDTMTATGHVSILDARGNVGLADHVALPDRRRDGALEGFGALIGRTGRLAAAKARREEGRFTTAYRAAYTPCKICNKPGQRTPVWEVKSYRV